MCLLCNTDMHMMDSQLTLLLCCLCRFYARIPVWDNENLSKNELHCSHQPFSVYYLSTVNRDFQSLGLHFAEICFFSWWALLSCHCQWFWQYDADESPSSTLIYTLEEKMYHRWVVWAGVRGEVVAVRCRVVIFNPFIRQSILYSFWSGLRSKGGGTNPCCFRSKADYILDWLPVSHRVLIQYWQTSIRGHIHTPTHCEFGQIGFLLPKIGYYLTQ